MELGLIQVYTGDGKGKTTAAIGQMLRALGHGFKVCLVQFFKDPAVFEYGELKALNRFKACKIYRFAIKHPHFYKSVGLEEVRGECLKGLQFVGELFKQGIYDMIVLDEINIALRDGFLEEEELIGLLEDKPKKVELILTGRGATPKLLGLADLVSEMRMVKHPYKGGVKARVGIEY